MHSSINSYFFAALVLEKERKMPILVLVHFEFGSFVPISSQGRKIPRPSWPLSENDKLGEKFVASAKGWLAPSSNQSKGCAPKGINADMDVVP
jgi:hypothetical protein